MSVFVASNTQHAMHMRHIIICGCPVPQYFFPNYFIKGTIFEKSYRMYNVYCDSVFNVCMKTFLILRRNERSMIKMYIGLHVKHPLLFF